MGGNKKENGKATRCNKLFSVISIMAVVLGSFLGIASMGIESGNASTETPEIIWKRTWHEGSYSAYGYGVAVASSGNIYETGISYVGGLSGEDGALVKYDNSGNYKWNKTWDYSSDDYGRGVAVDSAENVYVAGSEKVDVDNYDAILLKFDSSGNLKWKKTWGWGDFDYANGVACGSSGYIYVSGVAHNENFYDIFLRKYDSSGNLIWGRTWDHSGFWDRGRGVTVDPSGYIYVTGGGPNVAELLKYDSSGNLKWSRTWDEGAGSWEEGYSVAVDSSGSSVYVTGLTEVETNKRDIFLRKYDSSGNFKWEKIWDFSMGGWDWGAGIAIDSSDSIYINGLSNFDLLLLKIGLTTINTPPTANFTYSTAGLLVSFNSTSFDSDGTIVSHYWNFGDGSSSSEENPTNVYQYSGIYEVSLTVEDSGGRTDTETKEITVSSKITVMS